MNQKITKYTIASVVYCKSVESATYDSQLEDKVNGLIAAGWQPFGGLQLMQRDHHLVALQPMVRLGPDHAATLEVVRPALAESR
ncbi:DUF1737 domain-containing protein [Szabonella alba]|uniref:DUF1737 domain-containing protein n=1 Tax=Szabonella alba TaxID=2804194 RepID=A0A8K0Y287_9RHOB|nr:DUF1737 domain-containing protein [Szabonella alba]MBL4917089.1 DUF1737 domain-containing protein [Szabonella alba]